MLDGVSDRAGGKLKKLEEMREVFRRCRENVELTWQRGGRDVAVGQ